jgi:hypothetical protein
MTMIYEHHFDRSTDRCACGAEEVYHDTPEGSGYGCGEVRAPWTGDLIRAAFGPSVERVVRERMADEQCDYGQAYQLICEELERNGS